MYAAAHAKVVRVSCKLQTVPTPSLPLHLSSPPAFLFQSRSRCFRSLAKLQATNPSPQLRQPSTAIVPNSPFPNSTPRPIKNSKNSGWTRPGAPRFILVPSNQHQGPHPAITILPPPRGMLCYVQIVSTPTADTPGACLMLHLDNRRYLFGRIAEGTQRTMVQRKVSLAKIQDIFLTGCIDWEATGGLLGMILTLADLKAASVADLDLEKLRKKGGKEKDKEQSLLPHLNIHGGKNLVHLLASARRFILRKALPVNTRELQCDPRADPEGKDDPDYEDENIRVWSIPLSKEKPAARPSGQSSPTKKRKLSSSSEPGENLVAEEADQNIREAVVKDMFNSKWKLDTLREVKLADVQLPAKIFIRNEQGHIEPYDGPPASDSPDTKVLVRMPWPASQIPELPPTKPSTQSMCYIVKCHPRRGKFDVQAATNLGVVRTDFKKLTMGQSVPGKDGSVVTPDMVIGEQIEGRGFAVIDLTSRDLIDDLLNRREWSNPKIMKGVDAVYWILSDGITLESEGVQQFIKTHSSAKHIVLGSAVCPNVPALESPASQLIKMNSVDRTRFPLPVFDVQPKSTLGEELRSATEVGRTGLKYQLAPKPSFLTDLVAPMDTKRPLWELSAYTPEVMKLAKVAKKAAIEPAFLAEVERLQQDLPSPQTEIVPLGTGSAMPSKYRNVSATLIRVPGWGSYILDCGENTLGQLRRAFGYQGADDILRDLRAIYISHAHADHHLGTVSVISRWREVAPEDNKLSLIATPKYQDFIHEFHQVQDLGPERIVPVTLGYIASPLLGRHGQPSFPPNVDSKALQLPQIESCFVDHCFEATAVVLTFPDTGLKLAYSGDCRPSRQFAALGRGAHLLIHECTFEDELAGDALAKKHSTLSEALDVGRQMEARRILLTHFSQRYPKLPVVDEKARPTDGGRDVEVLFAFDMMRVKLGEFKQAALFLPALRELLKEGEAADTEEGGV